VNGPAARHPAPGVGLIEQLSACVGADNVLVDADLRAGYELDWTSRSLGTARCVVRPADTAQVAQVVQICAAAGQPIVCQGGNTGLVGGGVPRHDEVLLSLRRLNDLGVVDTSAAQVTVGAGVTIEALQRHARAADLDFAVDWGARSSATVGGGIATNAGGSRVVRFGTMRAQVAGIQAVMADGSVVDTLAGLPKSTAGVHLPSMLCGSEGTLAVITAARLKLVPWYRQRAAAWVVLDSVDEAVVMLPSIRRLPNLDGVELLTEAALNVTAAAFGLAPPRRGPVAVMIEVAADHDPLEELHTALADYDGEIATGVQHDQLVQLRDHVSMAIAQLGVPYKLDVAVPLDRLAQLSAVADGAARHANARLIAFGHLAEGNLHLNFVPTATSTATSITADVAAQIAEQVLGYVIDVGGTISAEHGIGVAKAAWFTQLPGARIQRALKAALDPRGLLNPGVLLVD